jgi:hypothetical protein
VLYLWSEFQPGLFKVGATAEDDLSTATPSEDGITDVVWIPPSEGRVMVVSQMPPSEDGLMEDGFGINESIKSIPSEGDKSGSSGREGTESSHSGPRVWASRRIGLCAKMFSERS